jgi:hypothetical protein
VEGEWFGSIDVVGAFGVDNELGAFDDLPLGGIFVVNVGSSVGVSATVDGLAVTDIGFAIGDVVMRTGPDCCIGLFIGTSVGIVTGCCLGFSWVARIVGSCVSTGTFVASTCGVCIGREVVASVGIAFGNKMGGRLVGISDPSGEF